MSSGRIHRSLALVALCICFVVTSESHAHSPHDEILLLEMSPEYSSDRTLFIMLRNLRSMLGRVQKSTDGGLSWRELSDGLDNRTHLLSMAISPAYGADGTLFLGTVGDGIFKSTDRGESWYRTNGDVGSIAINLIEVSPGYETDRLVLAALDGGGLLRSVDGGESWSRITGLAGTISAIGYYSSGGQYNVWAAGETGQLHTSSDAGVTWRSSGSSAPSAINSIACTTSDSSMCFFGTETHGLLHVSGPGEAMESRNSGLPTNERGEYEAITDLAVSDQSTAEPTIFAVTWYSGVFRSTDRGKSWHEFDSGLTTDRQADRELRPHFSQLRVSTGPDDVTAFLAGFDGLFMSDNLGVSWSELETLATGRVENLAISPNYVRDQSVAVVTQNGGAYISENAGLDWTAKNQGFKHTHLWDIAFSPQYESDRVIFTISNHDFYWATVDQVVWENTDLDRSRWTVRFGKLIGSEWQMIRFPLQIVLPPTFPENDDVFFGTRREGIYKSEDAGASWSQLDDAPIGFVNSVAISPSYDADGTVYAAYIRGTDGGSIYRTRNSGRDWERVTGDFDEVLRKYGFAKIQLAISPNYRLDNTIFIGTADGLYRSTNAGELWTRVMQSPVVEGGYIRSIGISPNFGEDKTVYIGLKGKGLYKSVDGGETFSRVPNSNSNNGYLFEYLSISPGFEKDRTIFGSANGELLKSIDAGENWTVMRRPVRYEDSNSVVLFDGGWETREERSLSTSKSKLSTIRGNSATLTFVGSGVAWIGPRSRAHGTASIYIDGTLLRKVDQRSNEPVTLAEIARITGLEPGPHTIRIEATGDNPIEIDALDVLQ